MEAPLAHILDDTLRQATPFADSTKRVVMFSGGVGSWGAAERVRCMFGTDDMSLLFADTIIEDDDLYRFLIESAATIAGVQIPRCAYSALPPTTQLAERKEALTLVRRDAMAAIPILRWLSEGRTPWEVYEGERFIGNSRIDPCSKILKRKLLDKWRNENCNPLTTKIYFGIDWTEKHRLIRMAKRNPGWQYEAPLCEPPYVHKSDLLTKLRELGVEPPHLYKLGFAHNNCGGFCCKAGKKHFALLLSTMRDRFIEHELEELRLRDLGINGTIFKNGLTLRAFREGIEAGQLKQSEFTDDLAAGCGCALE